MDKYINIDCGKPGQNARRRQPFLYQVDATLHSAHNGADRVVGNHVKAAKNHKKSLFLFLSLKNPSAGFGRIYT